MRDPLVSDAAGVATYAATAIFDVGPYNRKYIRSLKHHLRHWGY